VRNLAGRNLLLFDRYVVSAVSNIVSRSERQPDVAVLERTYVETGVLPQLDNPNNQILYGRRGTGKSHVLRVLGSKSISRDDVLQAYIDIRFLGSAQLMTDTTQPITIRCVSVFKDLLGIIQSELLDIATDPDRQHSGEALEQISRLSDAISAAVVDSPRREVERSFTRSDEHGLTAGVQASLTDIKASVQATSSDSAGSGTKITYSEVFRDTVVFAEISRLLDDILVELQCSRLYVLIDEWTSIPLDIQPYVAEFLKRTVLPNRRITLKIASLEYRSRFSMPSVGGQLIGLELGGDIAANLDLDDYYVYDRNPEHVYDLFQELLFKHLEAELPNAHLEQYKVSKAPELTARLFTETATFVELVRAGEGVVRDFLGIFTSAFFRSMRAGGKRIDLHSVEESARDWYETDKAINLSPAQTLVLHRIMVDVIGERQAKSFLLARQYNSHPMIQSLFDLRLVHLILRGYSDKENPGVRYNIYSLDYGTYVDLKRTKRSPEELVDSSISAASTRDRIVPFADKRSIRRIVLDPKVLDVSEDDVMRFFGIQGIVAAGDANILVGTNVAGRDLIIGGGNIIRGKEEDERG
jgi:hypothetical protein